MLTSWNQQWWVLWVRCLTSQLVHLTESPILIWFYPLRNQWRKSLHLYKVLLSHIDCLFDYRHQNFYHLDLNTLKVKSDWSQRWLAEKTVTQGEKKLKLLTRWWRRRKVLKVEQKAEMKQFWQTELRTTANF